MKIKSVFFDLDGTIIHSEPTAAKAVEEVFRSWNLAFDPHDAQVVTGRTWALAFSFLASKYTLPVPKEQALEQVMEVYRKKMETSVEVVPGAVDAVRDLAQEFPLALVSGSSRKEILFALDHLRIRECFQVILGSEDYPRSKPAPDGYAKAMEMLSLAKGEALVFEDSEAGIASGNALGLPVVAITCTNTHHQNQNEAKWKIQDLTHVNREWIKTLRY